MAILTGIPRDSVKGTGGIMEVYICLLTDIGTGATMASGTCATLGTSAGVWKKFVLGKEAGSNFVDTLVGSVANASNTYEAVLTMIFKRNQVSKRNELKVLAQHELVAVINDNSYSSTDDDGQVGNLYIMGLALGKSAGGCDITSGVIATGAQPGDANNMTVVLRAMESYPALAVSAVDYGLIKAGSSLS
jgi:hypothetical protein